MSWGGPELIVENDWPAAVLVKAYDTGTSLTVLMYSAELGQRQHRDDRRPGGGRGLLGRVHAHRATARRGEARRGLVVVLRGPARLTCRYGQPQRRLPGRAGVRGRGHPGRLPPGQMVLVAFLVTFGGVRLYTAPCARAGPGTCRCAGARAPHGAGDLPAARLRLHRRQRRGRLARPGTCGGCCRPPSAWGRRWCSTSSRSGSSCATSTGPRRAGARSTP